MNNNSIFLRFLYFGFFTFLFLYACGGNGNGKGNDPLPKPTPDPKPKPTWNKDKTASVYFFSTLNDNAIEKTATYDAIANYIKDKKQQLLLTDKVKITFDSGVNGSVKIANTLKGFHFYGINKVSETNSEGTGIVTTRRRGAVFYKDGTSASNTDATIINKDKQFTYKVTDNCFVSGTKTFVKDGIVLPFSCVRFDTKEQVSMSKNIVSKLMQSDYLLLGSVNKTVAESLKTMVLSFKSTMNYEIDIVEVGNAERVVFVIHPHFWVLRQNNTEKVEGQINATHLQIEANVF